MNNLAINSAAFLIKGKLANNTCFLEFIQVYDDKLAKKT